MTSRNTAGAALLDVRGLTKAFDGNLVVDRIGFSVAAGEVVGLIGPNGAGKSTCFNMLNGQLRPDRGEIRLDGARIDGLGPERIWRAGVGRGFQVAQVFASLPVLDNVRAALLVRHRLVWRFLRPARSVLAAEAEALLERTGLSALAGRICGTLAYGDLKRLEIALAIANRPRLLLLDEPMAGMTGADRRPVADLIRSLAQETGCGVLLTEHDTDTVFRIADRVLVMDKGALIAAGPPAAVRADPGVRAAYLGEAG
ncbi:MAG TPA: ABC transporter ATP-binding protein [Rhodopila sp.]|uniref:ABC transporter ATP-binding protein n=1 Tax=Rhodopila sp. TaxID=2480087 RepID=UPI002C6C7FA4|nr:ABC transporter ATP-binding protein [Rhodopila sp.]HVY13587.1 ABC transporter ATP-binding protein [Rhodopila sp.]